MAKKIYSILAVISLSLMIYLTTGPAWLSQKALVWVVTLLYAIIMGCIHGIVAHTLTARQKGGTVFYPLIMGILFGILAFIFLFVILPLVIPGFMY